MFKCFLHTHVSFTLCTIHVDFDMARTFREYIRHVIYQLSMHEQVKAAVSLLVEKIA